MNLTKECIATWPKLAWVARAETGHPDVHVFHGPMVETGEDWLAEAVWDGDFGDGDFDRSDLVFGTGIRCRADRVIFVSSATGVDCLWHCECAGLCYVSNSLPALLAVAKLSLRDDYPHYTRDMITIEQKGMLSYASTLPTQSSDVHIVYFKNIVFDGSSLRQVDKPDKTPRFETFADYREFLTSVAAALKLNCESTDRQTPIASLVGVSSGYDSPAAAVIAKEAGCTRAATIKQSNSLWRGSDCGKHIAETLGLSCQEHDFSPRGFRREITIWALTGRPGGLNLTMFDYIEPLCVFFNGSYGDTVWDRRLHDLTEPVGDMDCLLGEFRLWQGMFHCVVPWWGIRRAEEINRLGSLDEMKPWALGTAYDRPVARKLVEDAGVPRGTFAIRKKNTSSNTYFLWPYSKEARESFASYLRERGFRAPPQWLIAVIRWVAKLDALIYSNITRRFGMKKGWRPWNILTRPKLLFQWANWELKKTYEQGMVKAGVGEIGSE